MTRLRARAGQPRPWYHLGPVLALAEPDGGPAASSTADVYVFDTIGGWIGVSADDFVRDVAGLDVDQLVVHLNSPGGDASEGVAIANVLRAHRARVVVRVDGLAASAASVVAMAGDEIVMSIGSQLMIHDAWTVAIGDAQDMASAQRALDSTSDALASTYAAKAGGTAAEWRAVMKAETWYTADEAVAAGLADRAAAADETGTAQGEQVTPGGSSSWWSMWDSLRDPERLDLSAFRYPGRAAAPAPVMPGRTTPTARAAGTPRQERTRPVAFTDDQLATMRQQLGLPADADEATIVAAQAEALAERAAPPNPPAPPAGLPDGVVAVEASVLDELRTRAARGDEARTRQESDDRVALVSAAVADGRITPARRDAWVARLAADPAEAETLASLQAGTAVPVGEPHGYAGDGSAASTSVADVRQSPAYLNWSM